MLRRPFAQALGRQAIAADRPGARVLPKRLPMRQRETPASAPVPVHVPPQAPRVLLAHGREWRSRSRELERALRPAGYTVLEAFTGPDALQQARRSQPDAIILDTALPDGDASGLCAPCASIPISPPAPRFSSPRPVRRPGSR